MKHKPWYETVQVGAKVMPIPLFNRTERPNNHLPTPSIVVSIERGVQSETGTMLTVKDKKGALRVLDAAWFRSRTIGDW